LGHGNEECESVPKVVEALSKVKAVNVATGDYTTFVVSDDGDVYSFGCGESASLGHNAAADEQVWPPVFFYIDFVFINAEGKTFA
jgi:alpha-tubulin suppressor-like RCC1 family protein